MALSLAESSAGEEPAFANPGVLRLAGKLPLLAASRGSALGGTSASEIQLVLGRLAGLLIRDVFGAC